MNRNTDPNRDAAPDELDALLAARPVRTSADFTSATLARILRERDTADTGLDSFLAARPVTVTPGFTGRVIDAVAAARRRRFVILRVLAPSLAAACLALVATPFLGLGHRSTQNPADRVAAALAADPELRALAALPASSASLADTRTRDLAAFADIDAALSSSSPEYAYGI